MRADKVGAEGARLDEENSNAKGAELGRENF
jgi:hypothetical protein